MKLLRSSVSGWIAAAVVCLGLSLALLVCWVAVFVGNLRYLVAAFGGLAIATLLVDRFGRWATRKLEHAPTIKPYLAVGVLWLAAWQFWMAIFAGRPTSRPWIALACGMGTLWLPALIARRHDKRRMAWPRLGAAVLLLAGIGLHSAVSLKDLNGDGRLLFGLRKVVITTPDRLGAESGDVGRTNLTDDAVGPAFPQLLGPNRDGVLLGVELNDWQPDPPVVVWRRTVGPAWSGIVTDGRRLFTAEQQDDLEAISCYAVATGEEVWRETYVAKLSGSAGGMGPRATPTWSDGRVYAVGATGVLSCLIGETGKVVWRRQILEDQQSKNLEHGVAGSPLVVDGMAIVAPSGTNGVCLAAYDAQTGALLWSAAGAPVGYSSPALAQWNGQRQVILFHSKGLAGFDLQGRRLWDFAFGAGADNAVQPIVPPGRNQVFLSTGQGNGCTLMELLADNQLNWAAKEVWRQPRMQTKFSTPVLHDGFIYGLDNGILACLELASGQSRWKSGRYGHGQLLAARNRLLVLDESGSLRLVAMDPTGRRELAAISVLDGKTWNHFAVSGRLVLARNSTQLAAVRLP